jgi:hypothetical protein
MDLNSLAEKNQIEEETNFVEASKRLCYSCMACLSFGFDAQVTISAMDILGPFLPHVRDSERLPIAAQAFTQLLGRLKLKDCRNGRVQYQKIDFVYQIFQRMRCIFTKAH